MLAGMELKDAAAFLLDKFQNVGSAPSGNRLAGVKYHGTSAQGWLVMDRGGYVESAKSSPIKDHNAFILFDEARCRCGEVHWWGSMPVESCLTTSRSVPSPREISWKIIKSCAGVPT